MSLPRFDIDWNSATPVYRQIAECVRAAAIDGRLQPGHRLPPTRDLARQLDVNRNTVVAAYEILAGEGWTSSHTGKGTFLVLKPGTKQRGGDGPGERTWFTAFSRTADAAATGGLQAIYRLAIATEGISFVGSYPADELMPVELFGEAMTRALSECGSRALAYGPTAGSPSLRATIAASMREEGSTVEAEDILITNGAQQALELVFRTLLERGDSVAIEEPTYTGALSVLRALGVRTVGIPVDAEGIRPDLLGIALERHRPRLIYVQPTFQNPTSSVMSEGRRREILALAQRHRCPVVEDDWAGALRIEGQDLPSLHALDGGRHVIYLSTFSKKLMPGLRIGWVAAPAPVLERLVELKRIGDCGTSPLLQAALDAFLARGYMQQHLRRVLPVYRERRDQMLTSLERHFPTDARWTRPTGGLFVWVTLPEGFDGNELFVAARQQGVLYSRGELFHSDASGRNCLRLTYSATSGPQIEAGVALLGRLIGERSAGSPGGPKTAHVEAMPIF